MQDEAACEEAADDVPRQRGSLQKRKVAGGHTLVVESTRGEPNEDAQVTQQGQEPKQHNTLHQMVIPSETVRVDSETSNF